MTINKSQGQSLKNVGIYLPKSIFSHKQLYVALSRVISRAGLKLLICDDEGRLSNKTYNVVYKEFMNTCLGLCFELYLFTALKLLSKELGSFVHCTKAVEHSVSCCVFEGNFVY